VTGWTGTIYPTRRAILLASIGAPIALIVGLASPQLWLIGAAWLVLVFGLMAADIVLGAWGSQLKLESLLPAAMALGARGEAIFRAAFGARIRPERAEFALQTNALIHTETRSFGVALDDGAGQAKFDLSTTRRGEGRLRRLWVRWQGPLGLVWKQHVEELDAVVPVISNLQAVKEEALRLFQRNVLFGMNMQRDIGDGAEFHALHDFLAGMDRRTIDWKQSAKHAALLAKEFHTERNQQVIVALDTGRLMCEPLSGQPRIDRALHAALLLIYATLKLGDKAGLFAFDAKPRLSSGAVSGTRAFPLLQHLASRIEYTNEETNYTLGLTQLAGELERRSLIVVFTDFADSTSAELMIENVERLLRRHLVLFVVFRDDELESLADKEPRETADMSRAVIADAILRERDVVTARLRRLGVEIVDTPAERAGVNLLNSYFDLKRRNVI
jgi:uncharacterized protein (DUF58 family)